MAGGLIRDDKRAPDYRASTLAGVALRLGMSCATLRRHLKDEGTGFRALRERIYNELAQGWLREPDVGIEAIAGRLGFSDGFAFRRFFRRLNGIAPYACGRRRRRSGDEQRGPAIATARPSGGGAR